MPRMTVNRQPVQFAMDGQTPLLWALRDAANLTGTKFGCGEGDCGACMVLIDGEALRSCLITLAEAEGRFITTIEGLSANRSHPVQQAMVEQQAIQCGFCTPGIVMAATALIAKNANPAKADIEEAIPNLCRCGVYPRLVRAVQRAADATYRGAIINAAPAPGISLDEASGTVPAISAAQGRADDGQNAGANVTGSGAGGPVRLVPGEGGGLSVPHFTPEEAGFINPALGTEGAAGAEGAAGPAGPAGPAGAAGAEGAAGSAPNSENASSGVSGGASSGEGTGKPSAGRPPVPDPTASSN